MFVLKQALLHKLNITLKHCLTVIMVNVYAQFYLVALVKHITDNISLLSNNPFPLFKFLYFLYHNAYLSFYNISQ